MDRVLNIKHITLLYIYVFEVTGFEKKYAEKLKFHLSNFFDLSILR
jgi:hypothetical protein